MKGLGVYWYCGVCVLVALVCPAGATGAPVMVEKNLFSEDRKPTPPETAAPKPQTSKSGLNPKAFQLDGVFIHGDSKKAIVRFKGQVPGTEKTKAPPFATVREGEKIGDYRVLKIEPKRITLEKDGENIAVDLFMEGKVVPPPPPVPGGPGIPNPLAAQGGGPPDASAGPEGRPGRAPRIPRPGAAGENIAPPGMGGPGAGGPIPGLNPQGAPGSEMNPPEEELPDEDVGGEEELLMDEGG